MMHPAPLLRDGDVCFLPAGATSGRYRVSGTLDVASVCFALVKRPSLVHRTLTRWLLGWVWEDGPQDDQAELVALRQRARRLEDATTALLALVIIAAVVLAFTS